MVSLARPSPQPKRHLDRFSCFCTAHCRVLLYYTVGRPFHPVKITPSRRRSGPQYNTWFLGPSGSSTQTASWLVQPFLQGSLMWQTDQQTDRPRYSVCNNYAAYCVSWQQGQKTRCALPSPHAATEWNAFAANNVTQQQTGQFRLCWGWFRRPACGLCLVKHL